MIKERAAHICTRREQKLLIAAAVASAAWLVMAAGVRGDEATRGLSSADRSKLHEPVFRVSKQPDAGALQQVAAAVPASSSSLADRELLAEPAREPSAQADGHPLDPALAMAFDSLRHVEKHVDDYTCTLVKRERVHGELLEYEFISCKIRHGRENGSVPFSVYLAFRKPDTMKGREVIYVEGQNGGKVVAHEGGFKGRFLPTVDLMPTSALAMKGNRYPITEIGILTLTRRLIEKGERDRRQGECHVRMVEGAKVRDRVCTMLEVVHPEPRPHFDFHLARVFMDDELKLPIRYEAYGWPSAGEKPPLLEEYTYMDVKVNVGLTDEDFSRANPKYRF
ncbi:MAG: DUF1571 domain-containing protein [Planctomycetales bacterium]|nr:DUF1571 domain-containing protein [Planctomycetales bacterium]